MPLIILTLPHSDGGVTLIGFGGPLFPLCLLNSEWWRTMAPPGGIHSIPIMNWNQSPPQPIHSSISLMHGMNGRVSFEYGRVELNETEEAMMDFVSLFTNSFKTHPSLSSTSSFLPFVGEWKVNKNFCECSLSAGNRKHEKFKEKVGKWSGIGDKEIPSLPN